LVYSDVCSFQTCQYSFFQRIWLDYFIYLFSQFACLDRRYGRDGITSVSLHPGVIQSTEFGRHQATLVQNLFHSIPWFFKTPESGAAPSIYCALNPKIEGGTYYDNLWETSTTKQASSIQDAQRLWRIGEGLIKSKTTK